MIRLGMFMDDRYEILKKIGSGGMSDVYKVKDHKLNRLVAIKFLKPEFSKDKNFVSKFKIEAQNAAALVNPNVVSVYDVNEYEGIYYIVMEYVDGITLKEYIERNGKLPVKEATSIAIQVAQGIEAAHNANIIHRDIKPQNVLISREGKIKVTDFGIARTTTANTIGNDILGSVHYISPEQARGGSVDERSDIYSFGIVFYEMVTGQLPYEGDSTVSIALKHIQENVPLVSDISPTTPTSVVKIIEKCTQKKPERRYQKTSSLISDLKTSLITPKDNFVVLEPEDAGNATVVMTGAEARYLKNEGDRLNKNKEGTSSIRGTRSPQTTKKSDYRNSAKDPSKKKFDKYLKVIGIVAAIVIVVVLAIVCITSFGNGGCSSGSVKKYEVVNVVGMKLDDGKTALNEANFKNITVEYAASTSVEKDYIISQSVAAGTMAESSTKITLTVSTGNTDKITLEDYKEQSLSSVQTALKALGLKVKTVTENSDTVEKGKVIRTDPSSGKEVASGDTVTIYVSNGPASEKAEVPYVIGLSQADAVTMLNDVGIEASAVPGYSSDYGAGVVYYQGTAAGTSVDQGSTVIIYVSQGSEPETTSEETTSEETTETTSEETTETTSEETTTSEEEVLPIEEN